MGNWIRSEHRCSPCVRRVIGGLLGGLLVFLSMTLPLPATADTQSSAAHEAFGRGYAQARARNYKQAIAEYDKAIRLDPTYWEAYVNRGSSYDSLRQYQRAIDDFDAALRIKRDARMYARRAQAYQGLGQYDRALQDVNEALRLDPQYPLAYNAGAWVHATARDEKYRDGQKSIELATRACTLTGWNAADYIDTSAAAYAETGNFVEAVKWQQQSLTLPDPLTRPDESRARLELYRKGIAYRE